MIYQKVSKWNVGFEIIILIFFQLLFLVITYSYYKSPVLNGGYDFLEFSRIIILKSALISTPILILARGYSVKLIPIKDDYISIRGENKLDILKIKKTGLSLCFKFAKLCRDFLYGGESAKNKINPQ